MSLMKTKRGKMFLLLGLMVLMIAVLSGCSPSGAASVTHTTEDLKNGGFWQSNVVYYFAIALDTFAKWFNGQYGLAVLVMVIIVRTLILPLTIKQVKSSRAMQAIQPELEKIKKKYKDEPEKVQQETMRLFQENKVNPMAGCLPLIVQMPIFIALYNSIYYNPDLRLHDFLWLQLGKPDHLFILPLLAAATTFIQTRMMTKMNPVQQQGPMQFMMMVYPVLIFIMSYNFPSALPLYWFYSNLYTIIQNYFLYRNNDKHKAAIAAASATATATAGNGKAKEVNLTKSKNSNNNARKDVTPAAKGNSSKGKKGVKKSK
ncbi:YidC/Oxa1 family membrane protein insertase [Paenibacillus borealis]|uniref:Membrane protein insertase YidC n=1 Tax=Paenibacillus borealis TaxID=160799 RepID=A0A089MZA5_PAEBO|nr:YidC/Oxa1 family membrane protein insertase [Paenibacillus borealis]AIQ61739.1 membrane protein [Paenibacillus borealis]